MYTLNIIMYKSVIIILDLPASIVRKKDNILDYRRLYK